MATSGRVQVDADDRRVVWRPDPASLWLRGAAFLVLGFGLPAVVVGGEPPPGATVAALAVTVATAAWFVSGLRAGWELDEHGIEADVGRRRPTRIPWTDVRRLAVVPADAGCELVAVTRTDRHVTVARGDAGQLRDALDSAVRVGIVPAHVELAAPDA